MAKNIGDIFKCTLCGEIVEVIHGCSETTICCSKEMVQMVENTVDASKEKHVPVIEKIENGYKVKVGAVAHPMEEKHYIEWIELIAGSRRYRKHLMPGEAPEATFEIKAEKVEARAYCNLHGLWKA